MSLISIVVPVYHNATSLPELLRRLEQLADNEPETFEFIFVDDGSRDDSFHVLEQLAHQNSQVVAIKLSRNFGSSAACSAGIFCSRGDAVIAISADLQDPPELIHEMLVKWREGYKIVLAARASRRDPWLTLLTSGLYWKLLRRFAIPTMPAGGSDFCLIDRQVLEVLRETHEANSGIGMVLWTGFEPAVIYYHRRQRHARHGQSMWSWSKKLTYLIDTFVSFSHFPIRAASLLGVVIASLGFIYAAIVIVARLGFGAMYVPSWASLMVAILVIGGVQLLVTGLLGEYLVRTLEAARRRPPFVIERVLQSLDTNARDQCGASESPRPLDALTEAVVRQA
jgi:dolichol-phosphate mannosyltransferase